jgi:elongation factor G
VGHGGTGKTSLAEAALFNTGVLKRMGKVDDGNTAADFLPEEIKKKLTISASVVPCEYRNCKINFLDTPGYSDFYFEVVGAAAVTDNLLFVVSATAGVEVQTQVIWGDFPHLTKLVFVNRMDRENADFAKVLQGLKETFSELIVPVQLPIGAEDAFRGVVDLLRMKALIFDPASGSYTEDDIPADMQEEAETRRQELMEAAAEADDDLLNKYLEGEELTTDEIAQGLRAVLAKGSAVPVFCGSALKNIGIRSLLDFVVECVPDPLQYPRYQGEDAAAKPLLAQVFKTIADPYIGRLTMFKVWAGKLKGDSTVYNATKEKDEKISQVLILCGKEQQSVEEIYAGDFGAVAKLATTTTADTLCLKSAASVLDPIAFPAPTLAMAIEPKSKGDEDKLGGALQKIREEDPSISVSKNAETKQTLLHTTGDMHMDIVKEKLQRKFGVDVQVKDMKIPYRETIRTMVQVEGKHKKQSGGHGQYGHVWIKFEPNEEDVDFTFTEEVFGGSVPRNFFPAVEKGLQEALEEGVLAGYPVTRLKATLYDGSYHSVDSSEMAFKMAARIAFKKGVEAAKPVLLEPIVNVEIEIPDTYMGDIIGDLNSKRGRVLGMEPAGGRQRVNAQVPLAEMSKYTIDLKSITQGRGKFTMSPSHYEEVPQQDADKIIARAKAEREDEK